MRTRIIFSVFATLALALAGAQAATWRTYHNPRFGTTAELPADWVPQPPPENGDGLIFVSPDKRAEIAVSGILNIDAIAKEIASRAEPNEDERVTYSKIGPSSVVVSGFKGEDRIFYRRSVTSCRNQIWNSVSIEYPASEKLTFDPIVQRVSASLRAGSGWMCR
jgi:serine/threonine-protein kinase